MTNRSLNLLNPGRALALEKEERKEALRVRIAIICKLSSSNDVIANSLLKIYRSGEWDMEALCLVVTLLPYDNYKPVCEKLKMVLDNAS